MGMEFSDYDGPSTVELQEAWNGLSEEQHQAIQDTANEAVLGFFLAQAYGDLDAAGQIAQDVVQEAHRIAGLPL